MPEHTEGPWRFRRNEIGKRIGTIGKADGSEVITTVEYWIKDANANLIAAAPDLLEALNYALASHTEDVMMPDDWMDFARAAIAKAKGE